MKDTHPALLTLSLPIPREEKLLTDPRELPCRDMDLDCLTGERPFGSYRRCYVYAPEMGKCPLLGLEE